MGRPLVDAFVFFMVVATLARVYVWFQREKELHAIRQRYYAFRREERRLREEGE